VASEDAQRAEALIRLLPLADVLLPRLETLAASTGDEAERARLLEALQVLTLRRIRLEQLEAYPNLSVLVVGRVARGRELVAPWMEVTAVEGLVLEFPGGIVLCGLGPQPAPKLLFEGERLQRLRDELRALGGLALPAVEQLLFSPSAPARLLGLALMDVLGLHPGTLTRARLQRDRGEVELDTRNAELLRVKVSIAGRAELLAGGNTQREEHVTGQPPERVAPGIEKWLGEWLSGVRLLGDDDVARERELLLSDLTNVLRGVAWQARDEQEYWNHARPLWRAWWRGVGPRVEVYDRDRWFNLGGSYRGYQFVSEPHDDKQSVLRILEPVRAHARLIYQKGRNRTSVMRRGVLPLTLPGGVAAHTIQVRLWVEDEWLDFVHLVGKPGATTTLWLHPELRRHLEATKVTP
jgi:hypothetical protein